MRTALVTGATGSVGQAIVERLLLANSKVRVIGSYRENSKRARETAEKYGIEMIELDFATDFLSHLPKDVSILVNNAGINITKGQVAELNEADWSVTHQVNLDGPFRLCQRYLPFMVSQGWGRIVNVSSIYGLRGSANNGPYNSSKHALSGLMKSIAVEYGPLGITCNEVCPGPIDSEMVDRILSARAAAGGSSLEVTKQEFISTLRSGRMVAPTEVASAVCYLTSEEASGINGASLIVDAGLTC